MKKIFKDWNVFEIIVLFASLLVITICFFVGQERDFFSLVISLIGVVSVLTISKGLYFAPIIFLVFDILYGIISIKQMYYGEAFISFVLMLPIYAFSIITWIRNRKGESSREVKINKIKTKEYLCLAIISLGVTVICYFLLKLLGTSQLIISTISIFTSVVASYLMLRRCSYYALGYMANDIVLIIMWTLVVINSGIGYLPMVINFLVFLVNDTYGLIRWKLAERKQGEKLKESP